jgi:hypothetical protein
MRYVGGDPWDPIDRKQREDNGRPCLSCDELGQYLNQAINNIRQNKRAIKVIPKGAGATDKQAEVRASIIRGIEYKSNAQSAYTCAFENAIQRSYGFLRLTTTYSRDLWEVTPTEKSFDQEIRIRRIQNPDSVLISPYFKESDASDIEYAFVLDSITHRDHKREFGSKTKIKDFESLEGADLDNAKGWITEKRVQLAELWQVDKQKRELVMIQGPDGMPIVLWKEELDEMGAQGVQVLKSRTMYKRIVTQIITNGLEVLEENPWRGSYIPIIPCFGKELWIDRGSGAKRELMSMVRLARDPQMLHAYLNSQEAEEAGKAPQAPVVGYVGQFETDKEAWSNAHSVPHSFLQIDVMVDGAGNTLPPPTQPQFVPNFAAYEVAKESARRAIMAAMGQTPLPTSAQRQNEKSGKALEQIQQAQAVGSFHFTDNFDSTLMNCGRQINELLDVIVGSQPRELPGVNQKDEHIIVHANDPQAAQQQPDAAHIEMGKGEFGETISTGPSFQSQRDQVSDFVDILVQNLKTIPAPPEVLGKMLALAIKMKQLGPIGDELADLLDPQDPQSPEKLKQAMMQTQQHAGRPAGSRAGDAGLAAGRPSTIAADRHRRPAAAGTGGTGRWRMMAFAGAHYYCELCRSLLYLRSMLPQSTPTLTHEKLCYGTCPNVGKVYAVPTVQLVEIEKP